MYRADEAHTIFYANNDKLYYTSMYFDLVNTGATYQRMVNNLFKNMMG